VGRVILVGSSNPIRGYWPELAKKGVTFVVLEIVLFIVNLAIRTHIAQSSYKYETNARKYYLIIILNRLV
jgi:hypothetical protein